MRILRRFCAMLLLAAMGFAQSPAPQPQTVWFCPIVPAAWNRSIGSADYLDLFAPGAQWTTASSHVQIFKMFTQMLVSSVPGSFSDSQLQQIFTYLKSHNIALAVEFGPLTSSPACGMNTEGFGSQAALPMATRVQQLGGNLQYIAFDEPMFFGSLSNGANACKWTAQQVAANAVQTVAEIKSVFPDVVVGDIEPVPAAMQSPSWLSQYAGWVDAWRLAAGVPFAFFHFDVNWAIDWEPSVESMRQVLFQRGVPFGIIYNGWLSDASDAQWIDDAQSHYANWEGPGGTHPDHVIFESWYNYPQHVLPESDPTAFTSLIDSYFRERTKLSLSETSSDASGSLLNDQGLAVAAAPIILTAQAFSGPGAVSTYVLSGLVPPSITTAVIQTCVNQCGEVGTTDINVYSFQYADSASRATLNFANGLAGWGVEGGGTAMVEPASDSNGKSILITATPAEQTFVNSSPVNVTPGSSFTLTIQARVSPSSVGSGYFALVFLGPSGTEISRSTLEFAPAKLMLGSGQTAADGTYSISFAPQSSSGFLTQAVYPGTAALWPAVASGPLDSSPYIRPFGIVNAADFTAEPFAPGTWFSIFGQNLGTASEWSSANTFTLGGASVSVCGTPAAISFNSGPVPNNNETSWQLNVLTPDSAAGNSTCPILVTVAEQLAQTATVNIARGILELFTFASSAGKLPVITHADYSPVGPSSAGLVPAKPGETVIGWGTGDCATPIMAVNGAAAAVIASERVAPGLCQINFQVPDGSSGPSPLGISTSPNVYTLSVAP